MKTVVVTGGSGYIASFVIAEFLNNGYAVRTSLRDSDKLPAIKQYLEQYVDRNLLGNLTAFQADLIEEANWRANIVGADGVIHLGAPTETTRQTEEELTVMAIGSALNILNAAKQAKVRRVIMTSSLAACTTSDADSHKLLDEQHWTDIANPHIDPYQKSHVAAEQASWKFAKKNKLQLTTILPGAVFGHMMSQETISTNRILLSLINGALPKTFDIPFELVDVEDLARLYRLAFEQDKAIGQRYLATSQEIMMPEVAKLFKTNYPNCHVPTKSYKPRTVKLLAWFMPAMRNMLPMMNRSYRYTTAKAENQLGWTQTEPSQTVLNAAESFEQLGLIK